MAHSDYQWRLVRGYFEAGLSLDKIVARDDVEIKSKSQISKRANLAGWKKGKNEQLIQSEIIKKQNDYEIKRKKETLIKNDEETSVAVIDKLVEERTQYINFFKNSAIKNQQIANRMLDEAETMGEIMQHSTTTAKNRDTVLGKAPTTAIQINTPRTDVMDFSEMSDAELLAIISAG
ncbi:MAG: hypothetical protein IBX55_08775 [Methyloprofundus sp.]|nr:hypothetical protein [Methyloprofundus sp.]